MADRTVYVHDVDHGADYYTSLNAALAGESYNLTNNIGGTGQAGILTIQCDNINDTTAANTGAGYTTNSSYYINIVSAVNHNGVWSTDAYRLTHSGGWADTLNIAAYYTRVIGIQIEKTGQGTGYAAFHTATSGTTAGVFDRCIAKCTGSAAGVADPFTSYGSGGAYYNNCLAYGGRYGFYAQFGGVQARNCTSVKNTHGFYQSSTSYILDTDNCLAYGNSVADFSATTHANTQINYCQSGDGTADDYSGGNNTASISDPFVDYTNNDFHLAASTSPVNAGTDLSGASPYPLSVDIDSVARTGTWDIGADEYVASGTAFTFYPSESIGITDGKWITKISSDLADVDVTDAIFAQLTEGGIFYERYLSEPLGATDSFGRSIEYIRPFIESLGVTDYRTLVLNAIRSIGDGSSVSDTSRLIKQLVRSMSDTTNVTDVIDKITLLVILRALAETAGVTDTSNRILQSTRSIAIPVGATDSRALTKMMIRGLAESEGVEDYIAKISGVYRGLSEAVNISDSQSILSSLILLVNMADIIGVSDNRAWARQFGRIVEATIGISDFSRLFKAIFRSPQDAVGVIDTTGGGQALMRSVYENIGVTEFTALLIVGFVYELYLSESISTADAATRVLNAARTVADAYGVSDFDEIYKQLIRYAGENVGLTETAQAAFLLARTIADQLDIPDDTFAAMNAYMDHIRLVSDQVGVVQWYYHRVFVISWLSLVLACKRMIFISSCEPFVAVHATPSAITLEVEV